MSTDSADNIPPGNDEREKGDTSDNTNIVAMMQKNMASLTSKVCVMQQKQGKKRKADKDKPGPSRLDLSDVSENEFGGKDELDDILEDVNKDENSDCDDMPDGMFRGRR